MGPKCLDDIRSLTDAINYSVLGNFDLLVGVDVLEVLITEDQQFPLSSVQTELVQAFSAELTDLDALNDGANVRVQVLDFSILQKVWFSLVSTSCGIGVFCRRGRQH